MIKLAPATLIFPGDPAGYVQPNTSGMTRPSSRQNPVPPSVPRTPSSIDPTDVTETALEKKLERALHDQVAALLDLRREMRRNDTELTQRQALVKALEEKCEGRNRQMKILAEFVMGKHEEIQRYRKQVKLLRRISKWHIDRMYLSATIELFSQRAVLAGATLRIARALELEVPKRFDEMRRGTLAGIKAYGALVREWAALREASRDVCRIRREYVDLTKKRQAEVNRLEDIILDIRRRLTTIRSQGDVRVVVGAEGCA